MKVLERDRIDAYLERLKVSEVRHDLAGLTKLQVAHLRAVPFHNLLLLANDGRSFPLPPIEEVVDRAIAGWGGNCDRTTPPFTALLQSLGFDAELVAATVGQPGDHFACVVRLQGQSYLCDVGNGHPYLRPWCLEGGVQKQSFLGWDFLFDPAGEGGPVLYRDLPDGRRKQVYQVDLTPRRYQEFSGIVSSHYTRSGFGPFLSGLRAVRLEEEAFLTLRDRSYRRYSRFGAGERLVAGRTAFQALLRVRFGLPEVLVGAALDSLERRRPELLRSPEWFSLGEGALHNKEADPPAREEVPDILVSLATVGREASVRRLLETLEREKRASGYPGRVGVLVVHNHDGALPESRSGIHHVSIRSAVPTIERTAALGLLPTPGRLPLPIGSAREAQVALLRDHLERPIEGLPHPEEHPLVVWMIDDDLAFEQWTPQGPGRHTNLLFRVARFCAELPQHRVALGGFTGDPPIPALDGLGGQLGDLTAAIQQMRGLGPEGRWAPLPPPSDVFDAYYDLSESEVAPGSWPFAPDGAGQSVLDVARRLLGALPRLLDGEQLTRPLFWDGRESTPGASLRRGGNAVFLDPDALFLWPTPSLACADGVQTRRADTLWAALALREDPSSVVEVTLPLLHGRHGQGAPTDVNATGVQASTTAQVRGVVLARTLAQGREIATALPARESRVERHRRDLSAQLNGLRAEVKSLAPWGLDELSDATAALDRLDALIAASRPIPGDPEELEAFVRDLPEAVQAWRRGW